MHIKCYTKYILLNKEEINEWTNNVKNNTDSMEYARMCIFYYLNSRIRIFLWLAFSASSSSLRHSCVINISYFLGNNAFVALHLSQKTPFIMSNGNGNIIVEFFSDAMLFNVCK